MTMIELMSTDNCFPSFTTERKQLIIKIDPKSKLLFGQRARNFPNKEGFTLLE